MSHKQSKRATLQRTIAREMKKRKMKTVVVQFLISGRLGTMSELHLRQKLEDVFNDRLRELRIGHCDGGQSGSGSAEIFLYVRSISAAIVPIADLCVQRLDRWTMAVFDETNQCWVVIYPPGEEKPFTFFHDDQSPQGKSVVKEIEVSKDPDKLLESVEKMLSMDTEDHVLKAMLILEACHSGSTRPGRGRWSELVLQAAIRAEEKGYVDVARLLREHVKETEGEEVELKWLGIKNERGEALGYVLLDPDKPSERDTVDLFKRLRRSVTGYVITDDLPYESIKASLDFPSMNLAVLQKNALCPECARKAKLNSLNSILITKGAVKGLHCSRCPRDIM